MKKSSTFFALFLVLLFLTMIAASAAAQQQAPTCAESQPPPPGMNLTPASGPLGTTIIITNSVTIPDANIYFWYRNTSYLFHTQMHSEVVGTTGYSYFLDPVSGAVLPLGIYDVVIQDNGTGGLYCLSFELTPTPSVAQDAYIQATSVAPTQLPGTGLHLLLPLAGAVCMAGGAMLMRGRKRR